MCVFFVALIGEGPFSFLLGNSGIAGVRTSPLFLPVRAGIQLKRG